MLTETLFSVKKFCNEEDISFCDVYSKNNNKKETTKPNRYCEDI